MAPKRKAASASASKDLPDAPSSKRKKTEAPVKDSIPDTKAEAKAPKKPAAKATKKTAAATKPKAATAKAAPATKTKAAPASKAKTAAKSTTGKAAKPKTAVKAKAASKKKAAPKKATKEDDEGPAAEKPKRARAPSKKQEEADEAAAEEQPTSSKAAAKPKAAAAKPKAATVSKAKAAPKKPAAAKGKVAAAKEPAAAKAPAKKRTKTAAAKEAEPDAEPVAEDEPEESKPTATKGGKAATAKEPAAATKAPARRRTKAAAAEEAEPDDEPVPEDEPEDEPEASKPSRSRKKAAADKPEDPKPAKAPAKRRTKAAPAEEAEPIVEDEPEENRPSRSRKKAAADEPEKDEPAKALAKRRGKAAAEEAAAEAPEEVAPKPEESKPDPPAKRSRRAPATKAAPKEEVEEDGEAAPMEGVESAAEQLLKPAAKDKAAAKPAARRAATKRKAAEVDEAPEEKAAADGAPAAEEPAAKRRAVAKGKKPVRALQPVEHRSHQKEAGEVFVIGNGGCGQLGMGEDDVEAVRARLSSIAAGVKVVQVAAGGMHSVALSAEGEVYTTGVNDEGALGRETAGGPWAESPVATGNTKDTDRWVKVEVPTDDGKIVQVSAGDSHTMALTEQGFIYGWGTFRNSSGVYAFSAQDRLALLPVLVYSPDAPARQAVKIVSGTDHVVALLRGGALLSFGTGEQGQLGRVSAQPPERGLKELLLTPAEVTLKRAASAVKADPIVDVAASNYTSFAVTKKGQVWAWGLNNYGQLAQEGEAPVMVPKHISALAGDVKAVGPGQHHTLFLMDKDQLLSAGRPTYGRLGQQGVDTAADIPGPVPGAVHVQGTGLEQTTVASIAAGPEVSAAVGADGRAWLWGFGTNGQLGNGNDESDRDVPSLLRSRALQGKRVVQVDFGGQHTLLVVTEDGAGPSSAKGAASKEADGAPEGMDIDAPEQAEGSAPGENGILAGGGHAEEAAEDGIAAAEPRQGDPLLQEISTAAPMDAASAEAAEQLPAAPAQPAAPAASAAAPDAVPQVDATAAAAQPAALTHSASGKQPPAQAATANGGAHPAAVLASTLAPPQGPAPVSVPAAAPIQQPVQALPMGQLEVGQAGGPAPSDAARAAEAAEVAEMVDSMINVPEAEREVGASQLGPASDDLAHQFPGLDGGDLQDAQPAEAPYVSSVQTSLPEHSALLSVPASLPGYVEPAPDQPLEASAVEGLSTVEAANPASEAPAQKPSDLDDWRESFYALSGSKPV